MKKLILLPFLMVLPAFGQVRTNLIGAFDYPPSSCSTTITFHWFFSTDLSVPVTNWLHLSQEPCQIGKTNYTVQLMVQPGAGWITAGASNLTGMALFPGAAEIPPLLRSDVLLRVK